MSQHMAVQSTLSGGRVLAEGTSKGPRRRVRLTFVRQHYGSSFKPLVTARDITLEWLCVGVTGHVPLEVISLSGLIVAQLTRKRSDFVFVGQVVQKFYL